MTRSRSGELRGYMYALVIFVGVASGILSFSSGIFTTYDTGMQDSEQFNKFQQLGNRVNSTVSTQISSGREQTNQIGGDIQSGVFILNAIWNIIRMVIDSLVLIPTIVSTFIGLGGFPVWVQNLVVGVITIGVLFGIVTVYRGVKA